MHEIQKNKKIINNAISAYFMIFVSWFFLLNKDNPYLNNEFVKIHTRSALTIHLWFFLSYFVFIYLAVWKAITLFWTNLHILLASISCIFLLIILVFWMYKAQKWLEFRIWDFLDVFKVQKIKESQNHDSMQEREKMNFIIAHIPFIGFVNYAQNSEKQYIQNATKLNLLVSVFFILFLWFGYINIANVLLLIYSIYIVFVWINIFSTNNIFTLNLEYIPAPEKKYFITRAALVYIRDYFTSKKLQNFDFYYQNQVNKSLEESRKNYQDIQTLQNFSGPKILIYLPIINFVCLFQKNTKQKFHIINGVILSIIFSLILLIVTLTSLSNVFLLLLIIAFCYAYGFMKYNPVYKMPYIYVFYDIFRKLFVKTKDFNTKYNKQEEVHLSVKK